MCIDDDRLQQIASITKEIYNLQNTIDNYEEDELTGQIMGINPYEVQEELDYYEEQLRQIKQDELNDF